MVLDIENHVLLVSAALGSNSQIPLPMGIYTPASKDPTPADGVPKDKGGFVRFKGKVELPTGDL